MFFKRTSDKINKTVDNANAVLMDVGESTTKLLNSTNDQVNDFSKKTNAVVWTIVGCIAVTTVTNLILLGLSLRMSHLTKAAGHAAADTIIRLTIGGK